MDRTIESVRYNEFGYIDAIIDGVSYSIPDTMKNSDRQLIAEWEALGNTIQPYEPVEAPLEPLTARQLRRGLIANGYPLSAVVSAIETISDPAAKEVAMVEWEYATEFKRDHPLIEQVGTLLGLSTEQIDEMWKQSLSL